MRRSCAAPPAPSRPQGRDRACSGALRRQPTDVVRLARAQRMVTVHWNTDPGDWRGLTTNQIVARRWLQTRPGSILVFHDGAHHLATVAALPRIIDTLQQRGYRFLTVPELLRLPMHYS